MQRENNRSAKKTYYFQRLQNNWFRMTAGWRTGDDVRQCDRPDDLERGMTGDDFSTALTHHRFRSGISPAMLLNSSAKVGPDRAAMCRHKFEGIFDMHRVEIGSRGDLGGFLEALRTNRYLAMDFWEMAESLKRLGSGIPQTEIVDAVVQCVVAGAAAGDASDPISCMPAARRGSSTLCSSFLTRNDVVADQDGLELMAEPIDPVEAAVATGPIDGECGPTEGAAHFYQPDAVRREPGPDSELNGILARLEMTSLELKLHLDDIDSRMSRMEPHLDEWKRQATLHPQVETSDASDRIDRVPDAAKTARGGFARASEYGDREDDSESLDLTETELTKPVPSIQMESGREMGKRWVKKIGVGLIALRVYGGSCWVRR